MQWDLEGETFIWVYTQVCQILNHAAAVVSKGWYRVFFGAAGVIWKTRPHQFLYLIKKVHLFLVDSKGARSLDTSICGNQPQNISHVWFP